MSLIALLVIAFGGAASVIYLLFYLPLTAKLWGKTISPRLMVCKLLSTFDIGITLFLVAGSWIGITSIVTGIGMMIFNVLTAIGISAGVVFVRKVLAPRWKKQFEQEVGAPKPPEDKFRFIR